MAKLPQHKIPRSDESLLHISRPYVKIQVYIVHLMSDCQTFKTKSWKTQRQHCLRGASKVRLIFRWEKNPDLHITQARFLQVEHQVIANDTSADIKTQYMQILRLGQKKLRGQKNSSVIFQLIKLSEIAISSIHLRSEICTMKTRDRISGGENLEEPYNTKKQPSSGHNVKETNGRHHLVVENVIASDSIMII